MILEVIITQIISRLSRLWLNLSTHCGLGRLGQFWHPLNLFSADEIKCSVQSNLFGVFKKV